MQDKFPDDVSGASVGRRKIYLAHRAKSPKTKNQYLFHGESQKSRFTNSRQTHPQLHVSTHVKPHSGRAQPHVLKRQTETRRFRHKHFIHSRTHQDFTLVALNGACGVRRTAMLVLSDSVPAQYKNNQRRERPDDVS